MSFVVAECPAEYLYKEQSSWLAAWLRQRLGCPHQAADLAHDTFVRVIGRRHLLQRQGLNEPRAYLATIARGLLVDHWRRKEIERAWLDALASLPEEQMPSPELRLALLETLTEIDQMLDALKPEIRRAFLLAQLDGLSCREIAEDLGVSLATAERYVARALRACYDFRYNL